ncbi:flavokinase domain-containing protein [Trichonephila clavata]|uniref:Flavokinase domain-containing protein n=1 Tax=Trichonephila clavata TaxID=2740835 RepID=A0A8X6I6R0_TRICU|nr:flavokinase domain-containing protein [Trichonephila clavata]
MRHYPNQDPVHNAGGGKSSKLYKDLVLDKDVAVSVSAYYNSLTFSDGYIDIQVIPKSGVNLGTVERELENAINNFMPKGITDEELQSSKYRYKVAQFDNLSDLTHIAMFYVPRLALDNIVISVAGCAKKEEIITLLDKYLSKLPSKRSKVRKISVKNDLVLQKVRIFYGYTTECDTFAQKGIAYEDPNYYNASVLINALSGMGLNSILMKELRQNLGITYGVYASIIPNKHGNVIAGNINTDSSTASQSISAIKDTLSKVRKEGIDEQLFRDTKLVW